MRNWIDLFESNVVPYWGGDTTPVIDNATGQAINGSIQGDHREDMSPSEAKQYLDSNPDGTLHHQQFENEAFVTVDQNGNYVFYNPTKDEIENWDWTKDIADLQKWDEENEIMSGWWYNPGAEMDMVKGGMAWWDEIRSGSLTPNNRPAVLDNPDA